MKQFLFSLFVAVQVSGQVTVRDQIVVTASGRPDIVEATPAAVTVITREEIERRAARDVVDVLREVPGLAVARTGAPGKATSIFLRGGSSKQALVLWNGVELNNPYFSGYDFGQLSTAGVERVEVVRGPFSALYGSEAVSGVVNVLTTPRTTAGRVEVEGGQRSLFNAALSGSWIGNRWSGHGGSEHRRDEGFEPNDDFAAQNILGGATFQLSPSLSAGFLARHAAYDLGIPRTPNADSTAFVPSPERRQEGSETQLLVPIRYEGGSTGLELRLSESGRREEFSDVAGPFGPEASDTDSKIRAARATARFGPVTIGGEWERSVVDHASNFSAIDARRRTNKSLFAEDRLSLRNGIEFSAGVRYDDFETFGTEISPRLAAAWLRGENKLRAAYGQGFRAPAVGELYSPFFGNPDLHAERSRTIEVGYDRFGARGIVSLTLFRSDYEELIVFGDDFRFQNIAAADAWGAEVHASRAWGAVSVSGTYTWLQTEDEATGQTLLRRPEHSGSVALGYGAERWSLHGVALHTGARADVTDLLPFGRVTNDAYTTVDLVASFRLGGYQPFLKIENLADERYEEVFGYPSAPRRLRVGVRYRVR